MLPVRTGHDVKMISVKDLEKGCKRPTSTLKNSVNMKVIHACRKSVHAPTFQ
jgi:hypothetical protein